jgi:hypothetical protein
MESRLELDVHSWWRVPKEDAMAKKKTIRKTTKVRSLPARKTSKVKGGSAISDALKGIGDGLTQVARKG